jgi:hypothetical protein
VWFFAPLLATLVLLVVLLVIDGRRRERAIERDWELLLTPRGQRRLERFASSVHDELALADLTYERAAEARDQGDLFAAYRLVDSGCELIAAFAPKMVHALAAWMVLSRMAAAVAPVKPLRPRDFHLAQLVQIAYLSRFLHHLVVSTAERFRLRVYLLQRGFRVVGALALRWRGAPVTPWNELAAVRHDVNTLSQESLETLRVLLMSLDAERRMPGEP